MKKIKKILYNIARHYAKRYLTGNLGKVVEDNEKITCYVKRSKIKKKDYHYTIQCFGIGKNQEKIAKAYKLNKPICYVIDGLELKKHKAYIFGYNCCEVIIKNCNFKLDLHVRVNGKCTLDNTNITTFSNLTICANELVIKNIDNEQIRVVSSESSIGFGADNRIDIIDSNIGSQNKNINVSLLAKNKINIVNSNIIGNQVECKSNIVSVDEKSSLIASDKVNLQTNDFNPTNIKAPIIVLNNELLENQKKSVLLKKLTEPLETKRLELVNLLKNIKTECENINSDKISEYEEKLNIQPVSKVLKR